MDNKDWQEESREKVVKALHKGNFAHPKFKGGYQPERNMLLIGKLKEMERQNKEAVK
jgi:hypothetical protein